MVSHPATEFDVVVIGGGAAGLMSAIAAGRRGRSVLVLEKSNKIGKKILMSGGGRCNFTNLYCDPDCFISANPRFCISALSRYTQWDFIALVEKHAIAFHEKTAGQLFCDQSAKQIVELLQAECRDAGVAIRTHCEIDNVVAGQRFSLATNQGRFTAESVIVASGGLSIPKMGGSDYGYRLARQFGHTVHDTRAGLVPFTFSGAMHDLTIALAGVSTAATVTAGGQSFADDILFTHRGISGPAALQVSSFWRPGELLSVDLLPGVDADRLLHDAKTAEPKKRIRTLLAKHLPQALITALQSRLWPDSAESPLAEVRDGELRTLADTLKDWQLRPSGTEGYRTAEVTLGGIDTTQLSSRTMESALQPGLFFVGEVVDVTGFLGGFNFQWAWSSGHAAGEVA